jgi:hypothetical protein
MEEGEEKQKQKFLIKTYTIDQIALLMRSEQEHGKRNGRW